MSVRILLKLPTHTVFVMLKKGRWERRQLTKWGSEKVNISVLAQDRPKLDYTAHTLLIFATWFFIKLFTFLTYHDSGFWISASKVFHSNFFVTSSKSKVVWIESTSYYNLKSIKYVDLLSFVFPGITANAN